MKPRRVLAFRRVAVPRIAVPRLYREDRDKGSQMTNDQLRWLLLWAGIFLAAQIAVILVINLYFLLTGG